jgi:hypothetical protein
MKYPHLDGATPFPDTDTRVYEQYRNVFDYNVWTPNTVIKLCRVNWYDDYHDAVKFPDDTARDAWFDKLDDAKTVKLTTNMYIARADTDGIKLPVPYMTAQRYNYIVVDFSRDIVNTPYQKTDVQTRYHFFITAVRAEAPNTTTCTLVRDVWTDYINSTTINGLLLSRGHAPLTETTPQKLLDNPRANCRDFTLPDVDYGNAATNIKKSTPINLQNGTRYICLATTFSPQQLQSMSNMRGTNVTDTSPSYTNVDETVNDFAWGAGNINTSNVTGAGTSYNSIDNLTASNVYMYALESSKASGDYFDTLFAYYPHIMSQIVSVFVATASMIHLGSAITVDNVKWHIVGGARTKLADIDLTANDFGYAPEYAKITRLYLAPYAYLEVSDNIGNKTRVEIADCGRLSAQAVTSLSYPILRQLAWLDGVGGDGDTSITINAINGAIITADVPNADMLKTLISHDIPTYALQRRAIDAQRADTYNVAVSQARQNAMLAYENGARSANVSQANTHRSSAAAVSNTARANQRDTAIKNESNSARSDNLTYSTTRQTADLDTSTVKINLDVSQDNTLQNKAFVEGSQTQAITNVASAIGTIAGAALVIGTGGAASPAVAGAMAIGGAALQGYNTGVAITNNAELNKVSNDVANTKAANSIRANTEQTQHAITQATAATGRANTQADRITEYSTSAATDMTATSTGAANANADTSRGLTIDNAKRIMTNARDNTNASWRDTLNHPARPVGAYGGDNLAQATGLDAMTIKIVTEDNGAIAAAGDYMLRYGIASNKLYNKPTLTACKHYTYWRSADIWLICPFAQNAQLQTLRDVFNAGVTIWGKPEEVGNDFMHDNL